MGSAPSCCVATTFPFLIHSSTWPRAPPNHSISTNVQTGHDAPGEGWSAGYNFGTLEAARFRWRAAIALGVDFIASDQYEALAGELRAGPRPPLRH